MDKESIAMTVSLPSQNRAGALSGRGSRWLLARLLLVALTAFAWSNTAHADESTTGDPQAEQFVRDLSDRGLEILDDPDKPLEDKKKAFGNLVIDNANIEQIGYFTLGRYRRAATPEQLEEFTALFEQYTRNFYESRLGGFSGESMDVTGSVKRKDNDVIVTSNFVMGPDSEISVNWRLEKTGSEYIIRDLEIAGIWLALEQRSQFTSVIANNGGKFDALLVKLRDMVGRGESFAVDTQTN